MISIFLNHPSDRTGHDPAFKPRPCLPTCHDVIRRLSTPEIRQLSQQRRRGDVEHVRDVPRIGAPRERRVEVFRRADGEVVERAVVRDGVGRPGGGEFALMGGGGEGAPEEGSFMDYVSDMARTHATFNHLIPMQTLCLLTASVGCLRLVKDVRVVKRCAVSPNDPGSVLVDVGRERTIREHVVHEGETADSDGLVRRGVDVPDAVGRQSLNSSLYRDAAPYT